MNKKPLVSVIIVNWNGEKIIKNSIQSILKQSYQPIELIVVDNNSSDKSVTIIQSFKKKVTLIQSGVNTGYAGGNNLGFSVAKGKYILLFNSDAFAESDFLASLVDEIEKKPSVSVLQPKLIYKGNPRYKNGVINSVGCYFTPTGFLYYLGYGKDSSLPMYNQHREIFSAYGACMLIRKNTIDKVGLFDEDFFLYFEETDFCIRVWLSGEKVVYTPKATVFHGGGASSRKFGNPQVIYHSFKNRLCSYIKTLEFPHVLLVTFNCMVLTELASVMYLFTGKFELFLVVQRAVLWNIVQLPQTLKKRRLIQQTIRDVKDNSFLQKVTWPARPSYYYYLFKGLEYYND